MDEFARLFGAEWDMPDGFFYRLRQGEFDREAFNVVLELLSSTDVGDVDQLPTGFVSVLWYAPIFMTWQRERVEASGFSATEYERASNSVLGEVERILGVP